MREWLSYRKSEISIGLLIIIAIIICIITFVDSKVDDNLLEVKVNTVNIEATREDCSDSDMYKNVIQVKNVGTKPCYARVELYTKEGSIDENSYLSCDGWLYKDGYFYYMSKLDVGELSTPIYEGSVKNNKEIGLGYEAVEAVLDIGNGVCIDDLELIWIIYDKE